MGKVIAHPSARDVLPWVAGQLWAWAQTQPNPLALADVTVWVPAPRQAMALRQAVLAQAGRTVILPRILPLAATAIPPDCVPPPAAPVLRGWQRQVVIAQLLHAKQPDLPLPQALQQAQSLLDVWDMCVQCGVTLADLRQCVPQAFAQHWQENVRFMLAVFELYPDWLAQTGQLDASASNRQQLHDLAAYYQSSVQNLLLSSPVWAAGFTDTSPAGVRVLQAIAQHPHGVVVVPQVPHTPETLPPTAAHYSVQNLWHALTQLEGNPHPQVIPEVLEDSRNGKQGVEEPARQIFALCAANQSQQAQGIAVLMREAVAQGESIALVTTNRYLAKQVTLALQRWQLVPDDSAGIPWAEHPSVQALLRLVAGQVAQWSPTALLNLALRHTGPDAVAYEQALRGVPLSTPLPPAAQALQGLGNSFTPAAFVAVLQTYTPQIHEHTHEQVNAHASTHTGAHVGDPPELHAMLAEWAEQVGVLGEITCSQALDLLRHFFQTTVQRLPGTVPGVYIWGPLEARLQRVGRYIIAGVGVGEYPPPLAPHPWLSRRMFATLGLPPAEKQIGMQALDMLGYLESPEVVFSAVGELAGEIAALNPHPRADVWAWLHSAPQPVAGQEAIGGEVNGETDALAALAPNPPAVGVLPVAQQPTRWSASMIGHVVHCPYRVYLAKGLGLQEWDAVEPDPDAALRGQVLHAWLQALFQPTQGLTPFVQEICWENYAELVAWLQTAAGQITRKLPAVTRALWRARMNILAPQIARALCQTDAQVVGVEVPMARTLAGVSVEARADVVAQSTAGVWLRDYKTGAPPKFKDILTGKAPQLAVEAWLQHTDLAGVEVWALPIGGKGDLVVERFALAEFLQQDSDWLHTVEQGVQRVLSTYAGGEMAAQYPAIPGEQCRLCPYAGVCRKAEWVLSA